MTFCSVLLLLSYYHFYNHHHPKQSLLFLDDKSWKACTERAFSHWDERGRGLSVGFNEHPAWNEHLKMEYIGSKVSKDVCASSFLSHTIHGTDIFTLHFSLMFTLNVGKYKIQSYGYCCFFFNGWFSVQGSNLVNLVRTNQSIAVILRVLYSYWKEHVFLKSHHNMKWVLLYHIESVSFILFKVLQSRCIIDIICSTWSFFNRILHIHLQLSKFEISYKNCLVIFSFSTKNQLPETNIFRHFNLSLATSTVWVKLPLKRRHRCGGQKQHL